MVKRSLKLTIFWVSMEISKGASSEFICGAKRLLMTFGCLRLIFSMHSMCYSIGYRYASESALSMLVFYYLGGFINCLLIANALSILVLGSCYSLLFWQLKIMWVGHRLH